MYSPVQIVLTSRTTNGVWKSGKCTYSHCHGREYNDQHPVFHRCAIHSLFRLFLCHFPEYHIRASVLGAVRLNLIASSLASSKSFLLLTYTPSNSVPSLSTLSN